MCVAQAVRENTMAVKDTISSVGTPQYVAQFAHHRSFCFHSEGDYRVYLTFLSEISRSFDCRVHAYVLMQDRIHLLLTSMLEHGVVCLMQAVARCYVRYCSGMRRRTGTMWEGCFQSNLLKEERRVLAWYVRIESIPVRSGVVEAPDDYPWTSYHFNGHGSADQLLVPHGEYMNLGVDPQGRRSAYRSLFDAVQIRARRDIS